MSRLGWERIDAHGDWWGVFGCDDYSPTPRAIFGSEEEALAWIKTSEANPDEPAPGFYTACLIRGLAGFIWNSIESAPPVSADEIEAAIAEAGK